MRLVRWKIEVLLRIIHSIQCACSTRGERSEHNEGLQSKLVQLIRANIEEESTFKYGVLVCVLRSAAVVNVHVCCAVRGVMDYLWQSG